MVTDDEYGDGFGGAHEGEDEQDGDRQQEHVLEDEPLLRHGARMGRGRGMGAGPARHTVTRVSSHALRFYEPLHVLLCHAMLRDAMLC